MTFYNKMIILALILLLFVFLPAVFPSNKVIFLSVMISTLIFFWITYLVLTDQSEIPGEDNDKIPIP